MVAEFADVGKEACAIFTEAARRAGTNKENMPGLQDHLRGLRNLLLKLGIVNTFEKTQHFASAR